MAADPEGAVNDISEFLGVCPQDASFKIQRRHSSHKIAMREDTLVLLKERTCSDRINLLVVVGIDKNREQLELGCEMSVLDGSVNSVAATKVGGRGENTSLPAHATIIVAVMR